MKNVKNELTKKEAAELLGVSSRTVERRLKPLDRKRSGPHGLESVYRRGDVLRLAEELGRSITAEAEAEIVSHHDATSPDTASEALAPVAQVEAMRQFAALLERLTPATNHAAPSISDLACKLMLTEREAAAYSGLPLAEIRAARKALKTTKHGRGFKLKREVLEAWVRKL